MLILNSRMKNFPFFESIEFEKWLIEILSKHVDVRDASDPMSDMSHIFEMLINFK